MVIEIAIVFVIFTTATWLGFRAVPALRANGVVQAFYQSSFGPAVMVACGREFREPDIASVPHARRIPCRANRLVRVR